MIHILFLTSSLPPTRTIRDFGFETFYLYFIVHGREYNTYLLRVSISIQYSSHIIIVLHPTNTFTQKKLCCQDTTYHS